MTTPRKTKKNKDDLGQEARADFAERKNMPVQTRELREELREHNAQSPELSAGDVDAAWDDANQAGDETVGGTVATPDQDIVEELGEAVGLTYNDDEPLNGDDKIHKRDLNRWELNPASARTQDEDEDWDAELDEEETLDELMKDEDED